MSQGGDLVLTLFTNDPGLARRADAAGIDRIGLDLERIGKAERQAGLSSWVSDHEPSQLAVVAQQLSNSKLFVRTNPVHPDIKPEIDVLIEAGAQVLMLPMFTTADEAALFVDAVGGRAEVSLLLETPAAAMRIHDMVTVPGIDEIHIGLNDLHLGLGLASQFEVLASDLMDTLAGVIRRAGIAFGFGGIGRFGDARLPIAPDLVYAQYARLGADRALVSRVFVTPDHGELDLELEVRRARDRIEHWRACDAATLTAARDELRASVLALVGAKRGR